MEDSVKLRLADNSDCEAVGRLIASVLSEYRLPLDPEGVDADVRDIEAEYFDKGGVFYVLELALD